MLWDVLGDLLVGLFTPGPPSTEKAARARATFGVGVVIVLAVAAAVLGVVGLLADAPDDRTFYFVMAGLCVFLSGLLWYSARRMVLDSRR